MGGAAGPVRRVPFGTITVTERARELAVRALESGRLSQGRLVRELEERFAAVVGAKEAVAVSSGTDAVMVALAVLHDFGASRGDEVIVPALSFVATGNAVVHAGFTPVFADVDRRTLNIDPAGIERLVTPRTRAILPVHLMGKPADMDAVRAVAGRHGLRVVEDAAEAHGALYRGRAAGSLADLGAFSVYVAHIITCVEGGFVTTDDPDFAEVARSLRSHGRACACRSCTLNTEAALCRKRFGGEGGSDVRFRFDRLGYSCKMNELEAAVGLGAVDLYDEILAVRRRNLLHVLDRFSRFEPFLYTIREEPWERIGPHAIPIVLGEEASFTREELALHLEEHGVETRTLFASMPTQCPGFAFLGHREGEFPSAEYLGRNGIHVGVHQDLSLEDMEHVLETLARFLEAHQS
jgi:dTDP-4-amino-4,6-dideoxygalactose transaminase